MSEAAIVALLLLGGYAAGCLLGAYYLVRSRVGLDLRRLGSGNAGARNAGRVLGPWGFVTALLIDAGKGALVTWAALRFAPDAWVVGAAMIAVVVGHVWPVQLRFRGGKGAATALGVVLVYDPLAAAILLGVAALVLTATRRLTLSGLVAIGVSPILAGMRGHPPIEVAALGLVAALILFAHNVTPPAYRRAAGGGAPGGPREAAR